MSLSACCMSCSHLGSCKETDAKKLAENYRCDRWNEVKEGLFQARLAGVQKYGPAVFQVLVSLDQDEED